MHKRSGITCIAQLYCKTSTCLSLQQRMAAANGETGDQHSNRRHQLFLSFCHARAARCISVQQNHGLYVEDWLYLRKRSAKLKHLTQRLVLRFHQTIENRSCPVPVGAHFYSRSWKEPQNATFVALSSLASAPCVDVNGGTNGYL